MTCRHGYDNLMRDILIYDGNKMELVDWLLHVEKVASLTHSREYELATAKSSTPYEMLKRLGSNTDWQDMKRKKCTLLEPQRYMLLLIYTKSRDQMKHYRIIYTILLI